MRPIQHLPAATRVYHGPDSLRFLGRELERIGARRVVVLCGASIAGNTALIGLVRESLGERCAGLFDGVRAHSPERAVAEAADALGRLGADAVLAVGGGSAIVTSRAASILLAEGRDAAALATWMDAEGRLQSPKLGAPKLPQFVVPTTPTNAMAKAGSAVLDAVTGERRALFDPGTRAQAIFVHPDFLASAPDTLVIGSALHALGMALEGLLSPVANPLSEAPLIQALRIFSARLPAARGTPDAALRGELVLAAFMSGQGTDATGAGLATGLGHVIGSRFHGENGILTAIMVPHALQFMGDVIAGRLPKIAAGLGIVGEPPSMLLDSIVAELLRIFEAAGVPRRLRDTGVPRDEAPELARLAMMDWFVRSAPRPPRDAAELQTLIEEAW